MPLGDFVEAGTVARPLLIGRAARLAFAAFTLYPFILFIVIYDDLVGSDIPTVSYWIAVFVAWWYFSDLVVVGFSRRWGRRPQVAVFPVTLALVVADIVAYGRAWAPPLGWGVFLFTEFVFGAFALSFFLAAVFAVPG